MLPYRKLEVWRLADEAVIRVYQLSRALPEEERFGLVTQLRRAAVSVPTNIAEGSRRLTSREYARFLNIAEASAVEVGYLLGVCVRTGLVSGESVGDLATIYDRISAMLYALRRRIA